MLSEKLTSFLVVGDVIAVLAPVEFHHQLRRVAGEIRDVSGDRNLPAEVPPFGLEKLELLPK
jgi:hypothetical protein